MPGIGDYIKAGLADFKKDPVNLALGAFVAGLAGEFTLGILMGPCIAAYQAGLLKVRQGGKFQIGDLFSMINKDTIVIGLAPLAILLPCYIIAMIIMAAMPKMAILGLPFILLGVVGAIGLQWALPLHVVTKKPFMDCIKGSIDFWMKNLVGHLIAAIVFGLVIQVGACACGIGIFATIPIGMSAMIHYVQDNAGGAPAAPAA